MDEPFDITVTYKGEEQTFSAELKQVGYTHRFEVMVDGTPVLFEPDEEGAYRALVNTQTTDREPDHGLLQAITEAIEIILR